MLEDTYATASKGCCELRPQADRERARQQQRRVRSVRRRDDREVAIPKWSSSTSAYLRKQFDTLDRAGQGTSEHAQKVATETAEPIKESFTNAFNKAA